MPDMRYELRVSAHEMLDTTSVLVEVWGHPYNLSEQSVRLFRRLDEVMDTGYLEVEEWVRDVLVGMAEHL